MDAFTQGFQDALEEGMGKDAGKIQLLYHKLMARRALKQAASLKGRRNVPKGITNHLYHSRMAKSLKSGSSWVPGLPHGMRV